MERAQVREGGRWCAGIDLARRRGMRLASFVVLSLAGCAIDDGAAPTTGEVRGRLGRSPADGVALDGPIVALAGGQWGRPVSCPSPDPSTCRIERNFWVDLGIRNDAYDKRVGIVWVDTVRDDVGGPWHVAYAQYEHGLAAPYEQWGVDVVAGVYGAIEPSPHIVLAAFVEMAGATSWDNNGGANHELP